MFRFLIYFWINLVVMNITCILIDSLSRPYHDESDVSYDDGSDASNSY